MDDHATETFRSLVPISTEALKTIVLLNGGAVVALLAYIGQSHSRGELARKAGCALTYFISGLLLAALAFGSAYMTQLALFNESVQGDNFKGISHRTWLKVTFVLALAGLGAFGVGAFVSVHVLASG